MADVATLDPSDVSKLEKLIPYISGLLVLLSNPQEWFRIHLLDWLLEVLVEALIIKPVAWLFGFVLAGFDTLAWAIGLVFNILDDPFQILQDVITGAINGLYASIYGLAEGSGLAAPIASVVTVVIVAFLVSGLLYVALTILTGGSFALNDLRGRIDP